MQALQPYLLSLQSWTKEMHLICQTRANQNVELSQNAGPATFQTSHLLALNNTMSLKLLE